MARPLNRTITMANPNLFVLSSQLLGDATQWNRIAEANGITEMIVQGVVTLVIPPLDSAAGNGGILRI